jgi:hypothetical protein
VKVKVYLFDVKSNNEDPNQGYLGEFELPTLPNLHEHFTFELPATEAKRLDREEESCLPYRVVDVNHVIEIDGVYSGWIGVSNQYGAREPTVEEYREAAAELEAIRRIHNTRLT